MPRKIFKYSLRKGENKIDLPFDAQFLSVGTQNDIPVLWATVNPEQSIVEYTIDVFYTGEEIPDDGQYREYIGTTTVGQNEPYALVYHVFVQT